MEGVGARAGERWKGQPGLPIATMVWSIIRGLQLAVILVGERHKERG